MGGGVQTQEGFPEKGIFELRSKEQSWVKLTKKEEGIQHPEKSMRKGEPHPHAPPPQGPSQAAPS